MANMKTLEFLGESEFEWAVLIFVESATTEWLGVMEQLPRKVPTLSLMSALLQ